MSAAAQQLWRLQKIAVIGGAVTAVCCTYFYAGIQRKISEGSYFNKAVDAVRQNKEAMELLGGDFIVKWVHLREPFNIVNAKTSQLKIPIKGIGVDGTIELRAACEPPGSNNWDMQYVAIATNGRTARTVNVIGEPPSPVA